MSNKKVLTFSIFDKSYTIATDEDERAVYQAACQVDSLLREIGKQINSNNEARLAIFSALKLALDLEKSRANEDKYSQELRDVLALIESVKVAPQS